MMHICAHVHVSAIRAFARNAHTYLRYVHMCSTSADLGHGIDNKAGATTSRNAPSIPLTAVFEINQMRAN